MRKSGIIALSAGFAVLAAGVVTVVALEARSTDVQRERVATALGRIVPPDAVVSGISPHGRPFLLAVREDRVSSAYADIAGPGRERVQVFLRELVPSTATVSGASSFVTLRFPNVVAPKPASDGSWTDTGLVGDRAVRYRTELRGDVITPLASEPGAPTPAPVRIVVLPGQQVVRTLVSDTGLFVELDGSAR